LTEKNHKLQNAATEKIRQQMENNHRLSREKSADDENELAKKMQVQDFRFISAKELNKKKHTHTN
jgi:hypothetical protein